MARNDGLAVARGEHIMFLDDDDLLRPETLERLSNALSTHPQCVAATAACRLYTENALSMKVYHPPQAHVAVIWRELLFGWWANSGQMMFRTDVVRAIGGYDPQYLNAQDRKLWLNVAIRGPVCVLPFVAMEYRQHARQISKHDGIRVQRHKIWNEFMSALPAPLQRKARGVRRAAELVQQSVESRANRQYGRALQQQVRACLAAPALLRSPILRRPLWWGIKKCLLRVSTP